MPTNRKRHTVTETDDVSAALARVREADPGHQVSLTELVLLGAERKVELMQRARDDAQRRAELRERLLQRTRSGDGVDWAQLIDVHDHGWSHTGDA